MRFPESATRSDIIAEIGLSHEGSLGLAMSMARAAIGAGADIVKFQAHFPEFESSDQEKFRKHFSIQDQSRWDYWKRTGFTVQEWDNLKKYVESLGARFSVSVFSKYALDLFNSMSVEILKLGSGDLTNEELREGLEDFEGTLIMSSGMATWSEIEDAASWLKKSRFDMDSAILQCTSMYPTPSNCVGINVMNSIQTQLGVPSGLSDHTVGITSSLTAIVFGARYIEKHFVLSKEMFGPDVQASITPNELQLISNFRDEISDVLNPVSKDDFAENLSDLRNMFGRSLGLIRDFKAGEIPMLEDFCLRKPAGGLPWHSRLSYLGLPLRQNYKTRDYLTTDHFMGSD